MAIVAVTDCMLKSLDTLTADWLDNRFVGLMMGTSAPQKAWTIANVTKAVFSGYGGEQLIQNWGAAALVGLRGEVKAGVNMWTHDGGAGSCNVTGYYVVDQNGMLQWLELFDPPYQSMAEAGDRCTVRPVFSLGSRFPS